MAVVMFSAVVLIPIVAEISSLDCAELIGPYHSVAIASAVAIAFCVGSGVEDGVKVGVGVAVVETVLVNTSTVGHASVGQTTEPTVGTGMVVGLTCGGRVTNGIGVRV